MCQVRVIKALEAATAAKDSKEAQQQWSSRVYTTSSVDQPQGRTQQQHKNEAADKVPMPGAVHTGATGTTAAPSQNRLSVDSWYYSLTEGSPNVATGIRYTVDCS